MRAPPVLTTMIGEPRGDYRLLDSGHGRKYEAYGDIRIVRPEGQALWPPALAEWPCDAEFVPGADEDGGGQWHFTRALPDAGWPATWSDGESGAVNFTQQCTPFRHLGYFPDMDPVWRWMRGLIAEQPGAECMNLFGYTGVGTLALAQAGATMVHVDASKKSVNQARANAALSGMDNAPIRWIVDDAVKFTAREVRRGRRYDGILLDPPKYGRGPDGEVWKLEEGLPELLTNIRALVDAQSSFVFLTVYAVRMSALAIGELMAQLFADLPGTIEMGELAVREESRGLLLPTAIFARWSNPNPESQI
jgi:23S rRNA (cytosine1962-C5)-methyltransferase